MGNVTEDAVAVKPKGLTTAEIIRHMTVTAAPRPVRVHVPAWGDVYAKILTVADVDTQQDKPLPNDPDGAKAKRFRIARGAANVLCDADGNLLFDPNNEEHLELIAQQPWDMLQKILETGNAKEPAGKNS